MNTISTPPPAGWYPSPDGSSTRTWWDGSHWVPGEQASLQPASTKRLTGLAGATQVLLLVTAVISIVTVGVEIFGLGAVNRFLGGDTSAIDQLNTYDQITLPVNVLGLAFLAATGVLWVVWQYRAAKHVLGLTRRAPGWHAGAWFVPVICWWFPYQNIADLWKAIGRTRPSWQIIWWVLWVVSSVFGQIAGRLYLSAESLDQYSLAMGATIASETLMVAAVPFAWLVVSGITRGIVRRSSVPPT